MFRSKKETGLRQSEMTINEVIRELLRTKVPGSDFRLQTFIGRWFSGGCYVLENSNDIELAAELSRMISHQTIWELYHSRLMRKELDWSEHTKQFFINNNRKGLLMDHIAGKYLDTTTGYRASFEGCEEDMPCCF
jgi:hypothetical protein